MARRAWTSRGEGPRRSLRAPNERDAGPSRDRRFPLLYEIQTRNHDLATSPLLTKLVRGTLDGDGVKIGYLFRFVLDRDGDQIRLTLQGAASPVTMAPSVCQTLFAGTAGMLSSVGFERLRQPVTDASAIAKLLGTYGKVREDGTMKLPS